MARALAEEGGRNGREAARYPRPGPINTAEPKNVDYVNRNLTESQECVSCLISNYRHLKTSSVGQCTPT
jgi:hypothetical protein